MAAQQLTPLWKVCATRVIPGGFAVGAAIEFVMCKAGFCALVCLLQHSGVRTTADVGYLGACVLQMIM